MSITESVYFTLQSNPEKTAYMDAVMIPVTEKSRGRFEQISLNTFNETARAGKFNGSIDELYDKMKKSNMVLSYRDPPVLENFREIMEDNYSVFSYKLQTGEKLLYLDNSKLILSYRDLHEDYILFHWERPHSDWYGNKLYLLKPDGLHEVKVDYGLSG